MNKELELAAVTPPAPAPLLICVNADWPKISMEEFRRVTDEISQRMPPQTTDSTDLIAEDRLR